MDKARKNARRAAVLREYRLYTVGGSARPDLAVPRALNRAVTGDRCHPLPVDPRPGGGSSVAAARPRYSARGDITGPHAGCPLLPLIVGSRHLHSRQDAPLPAAHMAPNVQYVARRASV